ncbi:DHHA1 domain-containing protein [Nanoarchaeota archaeon]
MLSEKKIIEIREELETCKRPLFFFHDDPDGVASFLLFYRFVGEGKGVIIKSHPNVSEMFVRKVEEYNPDKIFILDIAMVEQEFIDAVKVPVVWVDHHEPQKRNNVKYFNPRIEGNDNHPVSYVCYKVVQQDLWISMLGCVGDWFIPDFVDEFKKSYPDLLPKEITQPDEALFGSRLGKLIKVVAFMLKGTTQQAMKCVKIMTRIKTPYEILNKETPAGKFIYNKFEDINGIYEELMDEIKKIVKEDKVLVYTYKHARYSFTKDISNELLYLFPEKIIIIAREKSGEMRMSLRSKHINIPKILDKALIDIEGYGGGHEHACGACVKVEDFEYFINSIRDSISK